VCRIQEARRLQGTEYNKGTLRETLVCNGPRLAAPLGALGYRKILTMNEWEKVACQRMTRADFEHYGKNGQTKSP